MVAYVDCHSHVVPSGDDGAASMGDGLDLCRLAAAHGTSILFATPHVWPQLPLTSAREHGIRAAHEQLAKRARLELRLGFELTPHEALLDEDPARYVLGGTSAVLVEIPFLGGADVFLRVAEHVDAAGFQVVVAHPERTEAVLGRPGLAPELSERGWLLQVNATSLVGYHGAEAEELGWRLLEDGTAALVASDGHRPSRPPTLDEAHRLARARLGEAADALFDGSALLATGETETQAA
jgi:protein-tyrosine phosphatase